MAHPSAQSKSNPAHSQDVEPRLLRLKDAAAYLNCTVWFLRERIWSREIQYLQLGKRYLFDRGDLDRFVDQNKQGAGR